MTANHDQTPSAPDFSQVYAENVTRVYGFVAYRLRSTHEVEDLTQIVFEKALRAWHRFDPRRSAPSTWLLVIAKNVLIDHLRGRREALLGDDAVTGLIDRGDDPRPPETSPRIDAAIAKLKPREQTVLALRFGADLRGGEIAEIVGLSTDNIHQILSRSLRRLREDLSEADDLDAAAQRADPRHA